MDERLRFVARLLDGERMTTLCTEFGISRKTGYKIYDRYKAHGAVGLTDRSRRPLRHANQLPTVIERLIVRLKKRYPTWGAPKIREKLRPQCAPVRCPAISTVHAVLDRHGWVRRPRQIVPCPVARRPHAARPLTTPAARVSLRSTPLDPHLNPTRAALLPINPFHVKSGEAESTYNHAASPRVLSGCKHNKRERHGVVQCQGLSRKCTLQCCRH